MLIKTKMKKNGDIPKASETLSTIASLNSLQSNRNIFAYFPFYLRTSFMSNKFKACFNLHFIIRCIEIIVMKTQREEAVTDENNALIRQPGRYKVMRL